MAEKKCGNCLLCETEDGKSYCVIKDLFTLVDLFDDCDIRNYKGELYFVEKNKNAEENAGAENV